MATPISSLELRHVEIPRSPAIELIEQNLGRSLSTERRHYLAGKPVHCGDQLELYIDSLWIRGRYEWTARPKDAPILATPDHTYFLEGSELLRWPLST